MKRQNTTAVFRGLLAGICLIGISVTGCQTKTEVTQQTQKKTEEHETEKQTEKQSSAYTFTDDLERTVTVEPVERVAVLNASYADIWNLAGGLESIVGASDNTWTDVDIELPKTVVNLGATNEISLEKLIACDTDLVIASADMGQNVDDLAAYEEAGLNVAYFRVTTFDEYLHMLKICTDITGKTQNYEKWGNALKEQVDSALARTDGSRPKVLYVRATSGGVKVKNSRGSVLGQMLSDLDCINIADSEESLMEKLSMEVILQEDPDFIFAVYMANDTSSAEAAMESVLFSNPAWNTLSAVKENHFYIMDSSLYNLKPNARWGEAYEKLAEILYPQP